MANNKPVHPREILRKSAEYIERTQPVVDTHNKLMSSFAKRATQSAGGLVSLGLLDKRNVNSFIDKVASKPLEAWDFIDKLAEVAAHADSLGDTAGITLPGNSEGDAFETAFFPEAFARGNSGMID